MPFQKSPRATSSRFGVHLMTRGPSHQRRSSSSIAYQFITTVADANRWAVQALDLVRRHQLNDSMVQSSDATLEESLIRSQRRRLLVGLSCVCPTTGQPATTALEQTIVALALPAKDDHPIAVIHVGALLREWDKRQRPDDEPRWSQRDRERPSFPAIQLQQFLEHDGLRLCGMRVGSDIARLRALGLDVLARVDLGQLASIAALCREKPSDVETRRTKSQLGRPTLPRLIQYFLEETMIGQSADDDSFVEIRTSQFTSFPSDELRCVALLASYHCRLAQVMTKYTIQSDTLGSSWAPTIGTPVSLWNKHAQVIANAIVVFVGGDKGESRQASLSSSLLVNTGKSLVYLSQIFRPEEPPPYVEKRSIDWPKGVTLGWLYAHGTTSVPALDDEAPTVVKLWFNHRVIAVDNRMLTKQYDAVDMFVKPTLDERNVSR